MKSYGQRDREMKRINRFLICPVLALAVTLTGCAEYSEKLAAQNAAEFEEKKAIVTDYMTECLNEKYADALGYDSSDDLFEVYDLSKGGNQAWFNKGMYPAKARCTVDGYTDEFDADVHMQARIKSFDEFKDNFYGILYGEDVKQELEDLVYEYPLTDVDIHYLTSEDVIKEESELRQNLYVFGKYSVDSEEEVERLCELVDTLNAYGYVHHISIKNDITGKGSMSSKNTTSDEIRAYFGVD